MKFINNILYYKNLKLDIYLPDASSFSTIVLIHGGGIVEGSKEDSSVVENAKQFVKNGYAVVTLDYSLYPNAKFPVFIEECAQGVKWTFEHIKEYGGNGDVYVSGHSAGAYITMMLCMNKKYLEDIDVNPLSIKGWISDSGQLNDHFNVQYFEKGIARESQRVSDISPQYYVEKGLESSPIFLIFYTNDMLCRQEQNIIFYKTVKAINSEIDISYLELPGGHCEGACFANENGEYDFVNETLKWLSKH